ncbi:hypothetical protein GCM10020331_052470 [Ectobacillus funiculus]
MVLALKKGEEEKDDGRLRGMEVMQSKEQVFTREKAYWMYQKMLEIRKFEDKVHELFAQGILPGFVHLYAGEEAVAVGVCAHLNDHDSITSTHRGHGHCIAKGCDLNGMMAEIYGKATGLCKGKRRFHAYCRFRQRNAGGPMEL